MGKNKDMLVTFKKVLQNDTKAIQSILPNSYQKDIQSIPYDKLKKEGYKAIIFDVDNTIMPANVKKVNKELALFFKQLSKDFAICLVSNNTERRVKPVADNLNIKYIHMAQKPKKEAFEKALHLLNSTSKNTVMIGDQMLSDIVGGNNAKLYTILVEPYQGKYYDLKTGFEHILQNIMMRKIKSKIERYHYY